LRRNLPNEYALQLLQTPKSDRTPKLRISAVLTDNAADLCFERVAASYSGLR
jgi:hypothetical protein